MRRNTILLVILAPLGLCGAGCDGDTAGMVRSVGEVPVACSSATTLLYDGSGGVATWWCRDADGRAHGPYHRTTSDDVTVGAFDRDRPDGAWTVVSTAGAPILESRYDQGVPDGTWTAYDDDGERLWQHTWRHNVACGVWREYEGGALVGEVTSPPCDG